ncbi:UNVERIFIED_CONTAM: recombinase family protein [Kocuria sp. CPCC 205274]|uniref:Recombinase family protein n=1 Tax=Herbiconiux daphne TaxID=2970914 RepID=A0ABT2H8Y2_9MICO|nr:recombinase family protein [Herbiconiux daphne]MCS5736393.1 recombinase family protein [Herbiconiux daphne]
MANVGYIRVSSVQQHTDRQLVGVALDKVFTEKLSGKDMNRPELKAMLDYVREGDVIHVHELSRLGRSTVDVLSIIDTVKEKGASIQFHKEGLTVGAEQTAMGEMMITVMAAVATAERKMLLERQAEGYAAAKAAGRIAKRGHGKAVDRAAIIADLMATKSIRQTAKDNNVGVSTVQRIKAELEQGV